MGTFEILLLQMRFVMMKLGLEYNGLLIRCDQCSSKETATLKMQGECHSKGRDVSSAASNQLMPRMVRN